MPHFDFTISLSAIPQLVFTLVFMAGFMLGMQVGAFAETYLIMVQESMRYRVRPVFKLADFRIGFYWDEKKRTLYVVPIPCVGIKILFPN